jgi:hypothetical protein
MMPTHPPSARAALIKILSVAFLFSIIFMMTSSGLIALLEGSTRFLQPVLNENSAEETIEAVNALREKPDLEAITAVSIELGYMSQLTSVERFNDSRLPEHGIYLASMPKLNQLLMLGHVLLGVFCLIIGGLQFWPNFRKKYMKTHRLLGGLYVVTAPLSVVLALIYLGLTPPHAIYAHLVAWFALWIFGVLAIVSIIMAIRALRQRKLMEHQAWMALSFASLIVAPMLRWCWVLLGMMLPTIDQETINQVTLAIMLPLVLMMGYGLLLINRQFTRPNSKRPAAAIADRIRLKVFATMPIWYGLVILIASINALAWFFHDGTLQLVPSTLIPELLIDQETMVFQRHSWLGLLLTLSSSTALWLALVLLKQMFDNRMDRHKAFVIRSQFIATNITAGLLVFVGYSIGIEPQLQNASGGTTYTVAGLLLALFSLYFYAAFRKGYFAIMKEALIFQLAILPFNALLFSGLWIVYTLSLPADYIELGQGYLLPAGSSFALLFFAMIYVIYGQATREHN